MTFFNKKTEVMQIEMTPYGRYLYSIGKFKPHSYEFVDDDILYGNAGSQESAEGQGTAHKRIMEETPKLKINRAFQDEAPQLESPARIGNQRYMNKKMDQKQNSLFALGKSSYSVDTAPALQVSMLRGNMNSTKIQYETPTSGAVLIPQVDIDFVFEASLLNDILVSSFGREDISKIFDDGSYIDIQYSDPIMHIKEFGSFYEKENFEIEVFQVSEDENLVPLKFMKESSFIRNEMLLDSSDSVDPEENQRDTAFFDLAAEDYIVLDGSYVEYYFDLYVDQEISQEELCKVVDKLEITNQFLDEELICPDRRTDRFDIYATRVGPDDLEDCD